MLNVPERELAKLNAGMRVNLRVDTLPGEEFAGAIDRVSQVVDGGTGTFRTTAGFNDPAQRLEPGMFGRVTVGYDHRGVSLTVARSALADDEDGPAVFVVRGNGFVRSAVELGHVTGGYVEVRNGLSEGENVVTAGKAAAQDGSKVQVIDPSQTEKRKAGPTVARALQG
jgi:membrane fusion protein, multidrug efflux system